MNSIKVLTLLAMIVAIATVVSAHKKFYGSPQFQGPHDQCDCDCGGHRGPLPSRPYYGSGGYHQQRPGGGGYGNSGAFATAGSYGSGGGQTSGGY